MSKKYFIVADSETTMSKKVSDFGAAVCDKDGNIVAEFGVLVREFYLDRQNHVLFHSEKSDPLWREANLDRRYADYDRMLQNGSRMLATVPAINLWLAKVRAKYNPTLTAYNLSFDLGVCSNSGIDLTIFDKQFCLWYASAQKWMHTKAYRQFILDIHGFNPPTKFNNMSYQTKAEPMAAFVLNNPNMAKEPHTALEDARDYEVPILKALVKNTPPKVYMNPKPVTWRDVQVKDWYKPK